MNIVSTKQQIMAFIFGVMVLIWLVYTYVLGPQTERITALSVQYQMESQQLKSVETFARSHPDTTLYLAELGKKVAQSDAMLPNQPELGNFLTQAEQAAKASGLQFTEVKPAPVVNKTGYREIPLEISVKGSFVQTLEFLRKLEAIPRFNSVNNVAVQSRQGLLESKLVVIICSYGVPQNPAAGQPAAK